MVENLKDLEKLLKLCRKQGVTEINLGSVSLKLGDLPIETSKQLVNLSDDLSADPYQNFPQGDLSPTQLMFYSSGGLPEDDPELKEQ